MKRIATKLPDLKPPCVVSTIFAVDVEKYETMVVYEDFTMPDNTRYVLAQRYDTKDEATKGHEEVVKNLRAGKVYDGKDEIFDKIEKDRDLPKMVEMVEKVLLGKIITDMMEDKEKSWPKTLSFFKVRI